jgi:hypothetical protein
LIIKGLQYITTPVSRVIGIIKATSMEISITVPEYHPQNGIQFKWEDGFNIEVRIEKGITIIKANKEGLRSLANHLLNLAQQNVPSGYHLHFDELNSLEEGSSELIIERK